MQLEVHERAIHIERAGGDESRSGGHISGMGCAVTRVAAADWIEA
jgi:hypothetical protein